MTEKTKAELIKEVKRLTKENSLLNKEFEKLPTKEILEDNEANLNAIFENVDVGIILLSNGKMMHVNSTLQKMLGYSEKEFMKLSLEQIVHPHDLKSDAKFIKELAQGKRNRYQIEKRYLHKDGRIIHGRLTVSSYGDKKKDEKLIAFIEDITEQKQTLDTLAAEQRMFKVFLDMAPDYIYFKDLNSRFVKVNKALALKHGFASPELTVGKTDSDSFGKEHSTESYLDEQIIIKTGIPIIGKEEKEDWPDGRTTWALTSKMPLYDNNGKVYGIFGITRDITESKLVHDKIKESERVYRSLFESSDDGIFLTSEGIIIDCNPAVLQIFKCNREYVIGRSPADFSPQVQPDGSDSFSLANEKINLAYDGSHQKFEWQHKRPDGVLIDCEMSLKSITIEGKKLIQATMRDITNRKKSEKIREVLFEISEAAYTASDMTTLYKKIHEVVGNLMIAKNFYIALYDEKTEMISFPYMIDEYDPPYEPKKFGKGLTEYVLRKGESTLITAEIDLELRRTGEVELIGTPTSIWLGVPLKVGGKAIGVIVVQDYENERAYGEEEMQVLNFVSEQIAQVIERKRNSDAVKKYTEELKQLNATKDKFFSIIAHDLKNPFITLLGFSDLLISDFGEFTDEEKIYYITEMKKTAEVSHSLLQNLLHWSRSQTGRIEFNPQKLDLHDVISSNVELLKASAERKRIKILCTIPHPTYVSADEDMLNTIIRNLLTNSLKFTNKDGKIEIYCTQQDDSLQIYISDDGVGMSEKVKANLFRLDTTQSTFGTENEAGTGVGLILCKEFVEKHGGTISVESEVGKGSKFCITLPRSS
ncbi:MAG: PAS domain S-box protein [Ignavibacteriales bacterium]|nr:PAS domain S-box protein [Ignavibacteriales bacterium]